MQEALRDYTIDNRGDVGSWVRDAAMDVLVRAVQMTVQLHRAAGSGGADKETTSVRGASLRGELRGASLRGAHMCLC